MSFRNVSVELTNALEKGVKQSQGIFFTPKEARDRTIGVVKNLCPNPSTILEPSFGSGEFLEDLYMTFPTSTITGVELNPTLFASCSRPNIHHMDFLDYTGKHDVIVGNPPYFVMKKTDDTELCQTGRPNIFVQFLFKALTTNLNPNGILAFVLPTSFFNCAYYEKMRKWMCLNVTVTNVEKLQGDYLETQQDTFLLVVQNRRPTQEQPFFFYAAERVYISPSYIELAELAKGCSTLAKLGCTVKTGDVVWNQEKEKLAESGTLLIYSSNITSDSLTLGNLKPPKHQYIRGFTRMPLSGKAILISRGYGNSKYVLNPVLVEHESFYCENHVNVIRAKNETILPSILKSLRSERTRKFIELFVGNGALSKTELETCLPIALD
jgi:hypothetical protein